MWIPKNIVVKNLASYKNVNYEFSEGKAKLIQGINLQDEGQISNGSGKSLIPEAVIIAMLGEPFREVRIIELIRDDEEAFEIIFNLYNTKSKNKLSIYRKISFKSSQIVKLKINGKDEKLSSVTEYNKRILELIDISKEDLINYFIIYKDRYYPFFSTTDSIKKQIISRFSGANLVDGIEALIKEDVDNVEEKLEEKHELLAKEEGKIEVYKEGLQAKSTEDEVKGYKEIIKENENKILNWKKENKNREEGRKKLEKELQELEKFSNHQALIDEIEKEYKEIEELKVKIKASKGEYEEDLSGVEEELTELEKQLRDEVTCPNCDHVFSFKDVDFDIETAKEELAEYQKIKKKIVAKIEEITGDYDLVDKEIDEGEIKKEEHRKEVRKLNEEKNQLKNLITNINVVNLSTINVIESHEKSNKEYIKSIEDLKKQKSKNQSKEVEKKITDCNKNIEKYEKEIELLEKEYEGIYEWISNFAKFNNYLSNQAISSIEGYTNYYLDKFHSDLRIEIEGYRTLADGKSVREEIETNILRNGIKKGSFGRYSSGERAKISIANILALQKLINLNSSSGGFEYLCLDEICESVDNKGLEDIMHSLNNLNQTIDLLTHVSDDFKGINTVKIVKENDTSIIK